MKYNYYVYIGDMKKKLNKTECFAVLMAYGYSYNEASRILYSTKKHEIKCSKECTIKAEEVKE